jgi:hypothetical protein
MNVHVPTVETVRQMNATNSVAFFENVSVAEMDAWTAKLFTGRSKDDQKLCSLYRALSEHRLRELHRDAAHMFF